MKKRGHTGYRERLFLALLLLLAIPLFQTVTGLFREKSLKGYIQAPENPGFTIRDWFSETWQPEKEKWLNDAFGFRGLFVRINNQVSYSLFQQPHAAGMVFGKEGYLFGENYIKAWYGADFIGFDSTAHRVEKLKFIQDALKTRYNKNLMVVIAAGKGSFYPEFFPDSVRYSKGPTNYETMVSLANEKHLEIIDFNRWFVENKHTSPYPLYPRHGIHWSVYGTVMVADSLIRAMESLRNIDMPGIIRERTEVRKETGDDYDMGDGLNLLFKLKRDRMAYPVIRFEPDSGKTKPSVLVIADSFYWNLFKIGITQSFAGSDFWYYNQEIFHRVGPAEGNARQLNLWDQIMGHDVIMLLATESNLPGFGWGFIEDAYRLLQ